MSTPDDEELDNVPEDVDLTPFRDMAEGVVARIKYDRKKKFTRRDIKFKGNLFHRIDYHQDGSWSDFYGIEIDPADYNALLNS